MNNEKYRRLLCAVPVLIFVVGSFHGFRSRGKSLKLCWSSLALLRFIKLQSAIIQSVLNSVAFFCKISNYYLEYGTGSMPRDRVAGTSAWGSRALARHIVEKTKDAYLLLFRHIISVENL